MDRRYLVPSQTRATTLALEVAASADPRPIGLALLAGLCVVAGIAGILVLRVLG